MVHYLPTKMEIFTIGSSNRTWLEFITLLNKYGIEKVVDVRRFPTSRFPHFKKERLGTILQWENISYLYLGDALGGFRKGGYEAYMQSKNFSQGLGLLVEEARKKKVAVMCSERFAWQCHRRHISRRLQEMGWRVIHIIHEQKIWEEKVDKNA